MNEPCRHSPLVTSTRRWRDRLRERYWVRCWSCDYRSGPYESLDEAQERCRVLEDLQASAWAMPRNGHDPSAVGLRLHED